MGRRIIALTASGTLAAGAAQAGHYRFVNFDQDGASYVAGINAAGQIVGNRGAANAPFEWQAGAFTALPRGQDGHTPYLGGISDNGIVVGMTPITYGPPAPVGYYYSYLPRTGAVVNVKATILGPGLPWLVGVSNGGLAVGVVPILSGPTEPVMVRRRTETLSFVCGQDYYANDVYGINASGKSIGWCAGGARGAFAYTMKANVVTPILPSLYQVTPEFIDKIGRVGGTAYASPSASGVGFLLDPAKGSVAYYALRGHTNHTVRGIGPGVVIGTTADLTDGFWVYRDGEYDVVHVPVWTKTPYVSFSVVQVNASGSVVGNWLDTNGLYHGVAAICDADQEPCTR